MTNTSGILERAVVKSSVIPSLKYSWSRSPLMLANGKTTIEGLPGKGRTGGYAGGMDGDGIGGRKERCCTNMIVAAIIASPAIEKTPARQRFRRDRSVALAVVRVAAPPSNITRNTRTGSAMFLTDCAPRSS